MTARTVSIWPRVGNNGGLLWVRWWTLGLHKIRGVSCLAEQKSASHERPVLHGAVVCVGYGQLTMSQKQFHSFWNLHQGDFRLGHHTRQHGVHGVSQTPSQEILHTQTPFHKWGNLCPHSGATGQRS